MIKQRTPHRRQKQQTLFPAGRRRTVPSVIRTGCETSDAAAAEVETHAGTQLHLIWQALGDAAERGLTDPEIESVTAISQNSVRPRRLWLQGRSYIQLLRDEAGKPVTRAGCRVWIRVPGRVLRIRENA